MKIFLSFLVVIGSISAAKADLIKHDGYLKAVNPATGVAKRVYSGYSLILANDAEIISGNLIKYKGLLSVVEPSTGKSIRVTSNNHFISSAEVSE